MHYHYLDERILALQDELQYHPELLTILAVQTDPDPYIHIAEIAAYCKIVLDGNYTLEDIHVLCEKCTQHLRSLRVAIILPLTP